MAEIFLMVAKTMNGLEEILANELNDIGATDIEISNRAVSFKGDTSTMYKANYWCRTALHILKPIANFYIRREEDLYKKIYDIKWEEYLDESSTLAVDAVVNASVMNHSHYAALKTKDAIVDRFRDLTDRRPSVDTENPDVRINIHLFKNLCNVSIDSSGYSLHKRGYRIKTGAAPISEVLAAGMILLSGWDKKCNFIDPMCGSGTIVCEAALIANNIPPGYYRKTFGFEKWKDFDKELWEKIKTDALSDQYEFEYEIVGSDISRESIEIAIENAKSAKLHKDISFKVSSFETQIPPEGGGVMVCNPPYGERIVPDDIIKLYQEIGNGLKKNYKGYNAWIISSDINALKFIGLRPTRKIALFNGALDCRFAKFEIYEGSKRTHKYEDTE
ncbi:MAG: THUMP domain-containing class I SAM-dependent RNA methyltransferase [Bacteroidales bacterium]|jgi:putative N6-adenine-specific DNA methylase